MNKLVQMKAMQELVNMRLKIVEAELATILSKERRLRGNLAQLVKDRNVSLRADEFANVAQVSGAEIRWHRWVDARRGLINQELAHVLAKKIECQRMLRRAFGKDQALQALIKDQSIKMSRQKLRRSL